MDTATNYPDNHDAHPTDCPRCAIFPAHLACLSHTCPDCGGIVHGETNAAGEQIHECAAR